ncbi:MAG TPA: iron-sulfur cluster repair di-iron protein [Hyphomonadaceae bacterium]|nr:iron-sulfur cluster repair di-iron protein [Hyphomonadaceae bacterium]
MTKVAAETLELMRLGEIAVVFPGAAAVFRRHGLDFCCGGDALLSDAIHEPGIALDQIVAELKGLDQSAPQEHPSEPAALVDHILARYHETHRHELPELIHLAEKVERVHAAHPKVPIGLAASLRLLAQELDAHMQKEEAVLFPMMRLGPQPMIAHPIARMRLEHDDHGERLREIERLYRGGDVPADGCGSWRALYAGVKKFADDLMLHIHLENNVLFPMFATELPTTPICPGMARGSERRDADAG